ncbi:hypothetical protein DFR29_14011 [Tahibacter aquaticus]|uniref:Uncharacterized protein n=1 Tax=Tahibacter aquaticus TaxID=520092 RepID=A0A4R6YFU5_9GAMM|nr:hypothetical protein [Tahibacter aquaticus]TDR35144.1 hypothetical protein DFR29_14011 [Tahibacter aquaticus]
MSIFLYSLILSFAANSDCAISGQGTTPALENEEEVANRTEFCVRGGLPMEIQFSIDENPRKFSGTSLTETAVDEFIRRLDVRVASLLRNAGKAAWKKSGGADRKSIGFGMSLEQEIRSYIIGNAARELQLAFCGDAEVVGSSVDTTLLAYFWRSIDVGPQQKPAWLDKLKNGRDHGTGIVLTVVALRLANPEIEIESLVQSFDVVSYVKP